MTKTTPAAPNTPNTPNTPAAPVTPAARAMILPTLTYTWTGPTGSGEERETLAAFAVAAGIIAANRKTRLKVDSIAAALLAMTDANILRRLEEDNRRLPPFNKNGECLTVRGLFAQLLGDSKESRATVKSLTAKD